MFDKRDVARLVEQIEAERVQLTRKANELQAEIDKMNNELVAIDRRADLLKNLAEQLTHFHDGTTPEPIDY